MPPKETPLTQAQINEFELNRLGYYCKVRESWNRKRKWWDFRFDFVRYDNDIEEVITKGTLIYECGESEAIKKRDIAIEYYLKKVKDEKTNE